jgi:hypothetical protein
VKSVHYYSEVHPDMKPLGAVFIMIVRIRDQRRPQQAPREFVCRAGKYPANNSSRVRANASSWICPLLAGRLDPP